jgi:hypothetical protein
MANHYISINRGKDGSQATDFTTGASSTAGDDIELRIADGASLSRLDVVIALKAFERYLEENQGSATFPVL